MRIGASVNFS
nr:hypothetical protein [Tanacetum cinerariifolium]